MYSTFNLIPFFFLLMVLCSTTKVKANDEPFTNFLKETANLSKEAVLDSLYSRVTLVSLDTNDSLREQKFCEEVIAYGRAHGDSLWVATGLTGLAFMNFRYSQLEASKKYVSQIPALDYTYHDTQIGLQALTILSSCYVLEADHQNLLKIFEHNIYRNLNKNLIEKFPEKIGILYYQIANSQFATDDLLGALPNTMKAIEFSDHTDNPFFKIAARVLLANIQEYFDFTAEWKVTLEETSYIFLELKTAPDTLNGLVRLMQLAGSWKEFTDLKTVSESVMKRVDLLYEEELRFNKIAILKLTLLNHADKLSLKERLQYIQELIDLHPNGTSKNDVLILAKNLLAKYYFDVGAIERGKSLAIKNIKEAKDNNYLTEEIHATNILINCNEALGEYQAAYQNLKAKELLKQKVNNTKSPEKLMKAYLLYQFAKEKEISDLKIKQSEELNQKKNILLAVSTTGVILLILLAYFLTMFIRVKTKANKLLEKQKQQLSTHNQNLHRFTGIVSHDLLSSINLILTRGELTKDENNNSFSYKQYLKNTQETCLELKKYCSQLLSTAKGQNTSDQLDANHCNQLLTQILEFYQPELEAADFNVETQKLHPLAIPQAVVMQLFHNVVTNAIKYVPDVKKQPAIRFRSFLKNNEKPVWIIEDNGPGLPSAHQNRPGKGNGLGLSLLTRQLAAYGIDLFMENREEGGLRLILSSSLN